MLATLLFAAAAPSPAHAVGMMSVGGQISCTAFPPQTVRGTATARGTVDFQLQSSKDYSSTISYISLGYSSVYAPWSYKWIYQSSGPFYAYGLGSIGNVTKIGRACA